MSFARYALLATSTLAAMPAFAAEEESQQDDPQIVVTGAREAIRAGTKTDTPITQVPQPITVITDDLFEAQGALSVSDTLAYVAGVAANPYGPDSRVDGGFVRGLNPLQFRDGMRDIFSFYASIRADPYNFSQVEVVRGPASVLFGQGSLGGIVNLVSKTPSFTQEGEIAVRYGTFDRKELLADFTGPITDTVAARIVGRWRDSGSQTDHVPDDRVMISPSVTWQPGMNTKLTLIGLYQEDDSGSTSQFLPVVGTLLPNPNGQLPQDTFVGKPGWDRYDGRLAQGTVLFEQRAGENITFNVRARYIDSDLDYFSHYPDSYSFPPNPYVLLDPATGAPPVDPVTGDPVIDPVLGVSPRDPDQRVIGLYADASRARMEIFSTDNNVQLDFSTGSGVEHTLLAGIDYSWNHVRKVSGGGFEYIDIYDIDYDALSDFGGGLPPGAQPSEDVEQQQAGFYLQDQIRVVDRVSLVLGVRHDKVTSDSFGIEAVDASATTFRAGIIAEIVDGVSPFFSYTESFEPISGVASNGNPFIPTQGRQYEAGIKFHPAEATLITATAYHIKESNRPIDDPSTPDPFDQMQAGEMTSKGFEFEAATLLPGAIQLLANYAYNKAEVEGTGVQIDNVPKHTASVWATKSVQLGNEASLRLGGGVRHASSNTSYGPAFPDGLVTPDYTLVDALAEVNWRQWSFALNATNLLGDRYFSACLARGDCFEGSARQVFGTLSYNF